MLSEMWTLGESYVFRFVVVLFSICGLNAVVNAAPIIDVGEVSLQPDTITTFAITVTGGDSIEGLNLFVQIGDGGGVATRPTITGLDIDGLGTIFHGNSSGAGALIHAESDYFWAGFVTTASGLIEASGILAYVTIDTTGAVAGQSFALLLAGTDWGDSDFAGVSAGITNGTINIIPEPGAVALLAVGFGVAAMRRRRAA